MDFGAAWKRYDEMDITLPPDDPITSKVLRTAAKNHTLHIGSSGWTRKEFVGTLYPNNIKDVNMLSTYSELYDCVELNATHYKIYSPAEVRKWLEKVKSNEFIFCPKFPQSISHDSTLLNATEETKAFLDGISAFGKQLGPVFLQLSEHFSPARKLNLYKYLEQLPEEIDFFVEVRHQEWFANRFERKEFFNTLREMAIGVVMTDTPGRRDCLHMGLTTPQLFLRFVTKGDHHNDIKRLEEWLPRLEEWKAAGLEETWFFLHVHEGEHEANFYKEVRSLFGLEPRESQESQLSLF
ncbi:DUF72 domain-containing protein [Chitinophaga sp. Hz27]|uniref:DUF72 domain-containing protein n=1 Tax=Chitinophaga sp. Hz27 TaxID=3347169 RepID=UPI0035DEE200